VVTYPYEWSYGMLRAAAAAVLEINEIANAAGWELADCHAFNVLFDGAQPKFVDLGSLMPRRLGDRGWIAIEEFVQIYDYALRLWQPGAGYFGRRMLAAADLVPHADYFACRHPWLARFGAADLAGRARKFWYLWRRLSGARPEDIRFRLSPGRAALALWLQRQPWLPFQTVPCAAWRRRVLARERRRPRTMWGGYQDAFAQPTPRFRRILEIVRELQPATVLELAGNQGWLAARLGALPGVERVTCTDAEETAVDAAHALAQKAAPRLNTAVLDFIFPLATSFGTGPVERLRSEVVLALAVTHHVLLTQHVPVDRMLASIGAYAEKFVLIEFMPLGLWDGRRAPPFPEWYSREWFRESFSRHFVLRHEEQVEENRILFVGAVRSGRTTSGG
jgi:SAM-dependent methyltransferase